MMIQDLNRRGFVADLGAAVTVPTPAAADTTACDPSAAPDDRTAVDLLRALADDV
jgi:hypothetical protein